MTWERSVTQLSSEPGVEVAAYVHAVWYIEATSKGDGRDEDRLSALPETATETLSGYVIEPQEVRHLHGILTLALRATACQDRTSNVVVCKKVVHSITCRETGTENHGAACGKAHK